MRPGIQKYLVLNSYTDAFYGQNAEQFSYCDLICFSVCSLWRVKQTQLSVIIVFIS